VREEGVEPLRPMGTADLDLNLNGYTIVTSYWSNQRLHVKFGRHALSQLVARLRNLLRVDPAVLVRPSDRVCATVNAELPHYALNVACDRLGADHELRGDRSGIEAACQ
jgi:hypothetical protein